MDGAEAVVGKTAGALAQVKPLSRNRGRSYCSHHHHALTVKKGKPVFKKCLCEATTAVSLHLDLF